MSSRTTLKTYFLTGATPTEAQFADLIDSVLVLEEDLVDNFLSTSTTDALTANAGKILNDAIEAIDTRVTELEGASTDYLSDYYTKTDIDSQISTLNTELGNKAFTSQVTNLEGTVTNLQSSLSGYSPLEHSHGIVSITGLQDALDLKSDKTYVDNQIAVLSSVIDAIDGVDSSHLDDYGALVNRVVTLESNESNYATTTQLSAKADAVHTHTTDDISDLDLDNYYNKPSVDVLLANVEPKEHSHVEQDITDLDKYTKAETDQGIQDHSGLTNNPHGVTKTQVGLDKVENLSVSEIFSHADAPDIPTQAGLDALSASLGSHTASTSNPHSVTKTQVGLGNVPDIDVNALLTAHLAADNPHNISSQYLDVYTKAETQTKIEENYDAHRYSFKPLTPLDGAGAIGDIAYDNTGLYFKFGSTDWRQIIASKVFNDGSPGSSFEIETPKLEVNDPDGTNLFQIDNSTSTTNINTTTVSIGGSTFNTFNVNDLFTVNQTTNTTNIDTTHVSIGGTTFNVNGQVSLASGLTAQGAVSLGTTLNVSGNTILSTLRATTVTTESIDSGSGTIQTTGELKGGSTTVTSLNAGTGAISTTGTLSTGAATVTSLSAGTGSISTTGTLSTGGATVTSLTSSGSTSTAGITSTSGGTFTGGGVTIGASGANQNLDVHGNATISGNLTINGTTTTIDTTNLTIEDNIVVLNKNQTGTPPTTLKSGIEVERGDTANTKIYFDEASDKWKVDVAGTVKTIAFTEDLYSN